MAKCFNFRAKAKHRIDIQSDSAAADDYGGTTESWSSAVCWAYVQPASDYQRYISQQLQTNVSHVFVIRYQAGLADVKDTVKRRIVLDSRYYDIIAIKNVGETLKDYGKAYQVITANEAGADGE